MLWNLGYVPQGIRCQYQVGVEGYSRTAVAHRADTAFTFRPLCSQWRGQLWRRLWLSSPLTPVPVATVTRPTAAIPWVIHLAAVRSENWNTLFKGGRKPTVYRL